MDAHRIEILDGADHNVISTVVTQYFQLKFLPPEDAFFDQYFVYWAGMEGVGKGFVKVFRFVDKGPTGTTHGVRRTENQRKTNVLSDFFSLKERAGSSCLGNIYPNLKHQFSEGFAVFSSINSFEIHTDGAYSILLPDSSFVAINSQIKTRLPPHGG